MKPLIGITSNYIYSYMPKLDKGSKEDQELMKVFMDTYVGSCLYSLNDVPFNMSLSTDIKAIEALGGIPVVIPQIEDTTDLEPLLARLDGILFAGGNDIDPAFYGEEMKYNKGLFGTLDSLEAKDASVFAKTVIERDQMELELMRLAIEKTNKPVLAICRGIQVMAVAMGGSVYQDLESCYQKPLLGHSNIEKWNLAVHDVEVTKGSLLSDIFKSETLAVNSIHHQAVKDLGKGLKVTAVASDGIIEAIETTDDNRFVLGIQWHPEMLMTTDASQRQVFDAFIKACKN